MSLSAALSNHHDPPTGSIGRLAPAYRRALENQAKSPRTVETYLEAVRRLDAFLERSDLPRLAAMVRRDHLEAFVADVRRTQSPATALARYRALQSFFRWCEEAGEVEHSPIAEMRPPAVSRAPAGRSDATPAIPKDAVDGLLAACAGRDFRDLRDLAIVRLFVDTGLRRNELAILGVADVDLPGRSLAVTGRGGVIRTVRLSPATARAIERYLRSGRAGHPSAVSPALWLGHGGPMTGNGIYQAIEARAVKAGLERISPDQLRQTFAHRRRAAGAAQEPAAAYADTRTTDTAPLPATPVAPPTPRVPEATRQAQAGDPPAPADTPAPDTNHAGRTPAPGTPDPQPVFAASTPRRGNARVTTLVLVTGLADVASIARFKRHLGRRAGVQEVGVSAGPDGSFVLEVAHDPASALRRLVANVPGFDVHPVADGEGIVEIRVDEPEA